MGRVRHRSTNRIRPLTDRGASACTKACSVDLHSSMRSCSGTGQIRQYSSPDIGLLLTGDIACRAQDRVEPALVNLASRSPIFAASQQTVLPLMWKSETNTWDGNANETEIARHLETNQGLQAFPHEVVPSPFPRG